MTPTPYEYSPRCGDVGFTGKADGGLLSAAILRFTTGRNEAPSLAHHQFQVVRGGRVVEALGELKYRKVVDRPFNDRRTESYESGTFIIVFRPPVTPYQQAAVADAAIPMVGRRYGYIEILLKALDGVLKRYGLLKGYKQLFSRLGGLRRSTMICSRVGNACQVKAGTMPSEAVHWAPDDSFDYAIQHGWEIVCMSEKSAGYWFPQSQGEK